MIIRRLGLGIACLVLGLLLIATALCIGLDRVITQPTKIKQTIAQSGVYNHVVPSALQQAGTIHTPYGNVSAANPLVQRAANLALTPPFVQQNTEMAIDNIYDWLNGKLKSPNFTIDLTGAKTLFSNQVADTVQTRINSLPACSTTQSAQMLVSGNYDALSSTCLPFGINPAIVAEGLQASLVNEQDFLPNSSLSASDIKTNGQPVFNGRLKHLPRAYRTLKSSQDILIILTVIAAAAVILLSIDWPRGLRWAGLITIVSGIIVLIVAGVFGHVVNHQVLPRLNIDNLVLRQDVRGIVGSLAHQVNVGYWYFGVGYVVLGAAAIGASIISLRALDQPSNKQKRPVKRGAAPVSTPKG